jgi:hypothetical protein
MREELRRRAGNGALRIAARLNRLTYIGLEYPPNSANRPRWGYDKPPHKQLASLIARHEATYRVELEQLGAWEDELASIDVRRTDPQQPCWLNPWLFGLDAASIYGFLRARQPAHYVEIGSGNSTMFAARAKRIGGLHTLITSIDPAPRSYVDELCDKVIRLPLENVALDTFRDLGPNDIVFVDNSHRAFMNSDVTAFFLDVLPELPSGVLVGIHDILLPDDYLPEWAEYWFSEQYLLAAYLLAEAEWLEPVLACHYVSEHPELSQILGSLWRRLAIPERETRGFAFWLRIRR